MIITCVHCGSSLAPGERCECDRPDGSSSTLSRVVSAAVDLAIEQPALSLKQALRLTARAHRGRSS